MPPDMRRESSGREDRGHGHKERIGNYILGHEIGRGSFATVYKGYRSVSDMLSLATEGGFRADAIPSCANPIALSPHIISHQLTAPPSFHTSALHAILRHAHTRPPSFIRLDRPSSCTHSAHAKQSRSRLSHDRNSRRSCWKTSRARSTSSSRSSIAISPRWKSALYVKSQGV